MGAPRASHNTVPQRQLISSLHLAQKRPSGFALHLKKKDACFICKWDSYMLLLLGWWWGLTTVM